MAVLRADLAGATGRVRELEAALAVRESELAFLRSWAEDSERYARSEVAAREAAEGQLDRIRSELETVQSSFAVRAARLMKRVVGLGH